MASLRKHDVEHAWTPSSRLRALAARCNIALPVSTSISAARWVREHEVLFSSKAMCTRAVSIIRYQFGMDYPLEDLRQRAKNSWIEGGRVAGDLAAIRNLGLAVFIELQQVLDEI